MKSIMVFNQKGGVGKSTTVGNLLAEFAKRGKKVLGIDIDGQGHLTKFLGIDTTGKDTVFELLKKEATFSETVCKTKYGDVIPSDNALQTNMLVFAQDPLFMYRIKTLLEEVASQYDLVLIDCPPALNQVTLAALVAVDYLIIPTEAEKFSIDGVKQIIDTVNQVRAQLNKGLKILGLLITKYHGRRIMTRSAEKLLAQVAKDYFDSKLFATKISFTADIPYSQAGNQSVGDFKPKSKAAKEFAELAETILTEVK